MCAPRLGSSNGSSQAVSAPHIWLLRLKAAVRVTETEVHSHIDPTFLRAPFPTLPPTDLSISYHLFV